MSKENDVVVLSDNTATPKNAGTPVVTNDMEDGHKFWYTLAWAIFIPTLLSLPVALCLVLVEWPTFLAAPVFLILCIYSLYGGAYQNGEYENAVGGLFGQPKNWVLPAGLSWWWPRPIGSKIRPITTEEQTIDHRKSEDKQLLAVQANDGGQVEVSFLAAWQVRDVRKAARFSDLETEIEGLLARSVRFFMLYWDSDAGEFDGSRKKREFSRYLVGAKDVNHERDPEEEEKFIPNNIQEEAAGYGVLITRARVDDVNPPQLVIDAREQAAKERAEAEAEKRDMESVRNRFFELKEGLKGDDRGIIDVEEEVLLRTVRTGRGNMEEIHVSGNAGDFSKGAAISRGRKSRPTTPGGNS